MTHLSDYAIKQTKPAVREYYLKDGAGLYTHHQSANSTVFYDRGIPDIIGYLVTIHKAVPSHLDRALWQYRYYPKVFIFPPWREIYTQDNERKQPFHEAVRTYKAMEKIYAETGYKLIEVPKLPVRERVEFVLSESARTS